MNTPGACLGTPRKHALSVAVLLAAGAIFAYWNSFNVPFLFDDVQAIVDNPSIQNLGAPWKVLWPDLDGGVTTSGRPLLNLSFALDYAVSQHNVWSYHLTNLAIHWAAAMALFGILRRVLPKTAGSTCGEGGASVIAASAAAVWMLHPLQTVAVTYLSQRAESLCGLFLLVCLMTLLRATESANPRPWLVGSVVSCGLGMATKEVMAAAPLLVLAFDRAFVAGTFQAAWKSRRGYYVGLAGSWLVLAVLVVCSPGRGTTAGFETVVSPWSYLLTQAQAIPHYLRLAIWPSPLIFDYGTATVASIETVWWQFALIGTSAALILWAVVKNRTAGYWGLWFFAILAPSSSFVPVASQTVAEHRMYLPLAAVVILVVAGSLRLARSPTVVGAAACITAVGLAFLSALRNDDFQSGFAIWTDTVAKAPQNPRARINLAFELTKLGDDQNAMIQLDHALASDPQSADAHYNRGVILSRRGDTAGAFHEYQRTIENYPLHFEALNNLGSIELERGNLIEAEGFLIRALSVKPRYVEARCALSATLLEMGKAQDAFQQAEQAAKDGPSSSEAEFRRGNALLELNREQDAQRAFQRAVELDAGNADAQNNLANLLVQAGEFEDALAHYRSAIARRPDFVDARRNAGMVLAHLGRVSEAADQFEELVRLRPNESEFRERLAELRAQLR